MYELTIYQPKKYETFKSEHSVSFRFNEIEDAMTIIGLLCAKDRDTRFEIKKVGEEAC